MSGRCHGPGCDHQIAATSTFCSGRCFAAWEAQFDGTLAGPGPLLLPLAPFTAQERLSGAVVSRQDPGELLDVEPFGDERGATYPLVAPEEPQVAHSGMRVWLGRWIHRMRRTE